MFRPKSVLFLFDYELLILKLIRQLFKKHLAIVISLSFIMLF